MSGLPIYGNQSGPGGPTPSGIPQFNINYGITAHSGGGTTSATPLTAWMNVVTVVGTTNDSVRLPPGYGAEQVIVVNNGANTLTVFGSPLTAVGPSGAAGATAYDTIAVATNTTQVTTGVTIAAGADQLFLCLLGQGGETNAPTVAQWKAFK